MGRGAYEVNVVYGIFRIDVNQVDSEYGGARFGRTRVPGRLGTGQARYWAGSVLGGDGAVADVARDGAVADVARDGGAAGVDGWLRDPRRWGVGVRDSVGKLGRGMDLAERAGHGE